MQHVDLVCCSATDSSDWVDCDYFCKQVSSNIQNWSTCMWCIPYLVILVLRPWPLICLHAHFIVSYLIEPRVTFNLLLPVPHLNLIRYMLLQKHTWLYCMWNGRGLYHTNWLPVSGEVHGWGIPAHQVPPMHLYFLKKRCLGSQESKDPRVRACLTTSMIVRTSFWTAWSLVERPRWAAALERSRCRLSAEFTAERCRKDAGWGVMS